MCTCGLWLVDDNGNLRAYCTQDNKDKHDHDTLTVSEMLKLGLATEVKPFGNLYGRS